MKPNAFDRLRCPFNYRAELEAARRVLNGRVMACAYQHWELGYRRLAKKFNISAGTLFAIAKEQTRRRLRRWGLGRNIHMREDAFDDLLCPFDYKQELETARNALNGKLIECVSRRESGYGKLAKRFNVSAGWLFAMTRQHKKKQKPGPRGPANNSY